MLLFFVPLSMSPHNERRAYPIVKSESPPLHSTTLSSTGQSHLQYVDTGPHFRFGTGEYNALPPFDFMSQLRSSWPRHTPYPPANSYSTSASTSTSNSQTHFTLSPMDDSTVLNLTDEYDDGDELGDLPSGSGSAVDGFLESSSSSARIFEKAVRRRSSKGSSRLSSRLIDQ
jgi:hypothetical protein